MPFYGNSGKREKLRVTTDAKAKQLGNMYQPFFFSLYFTNNKNCSFPEFISINSDRNLEREILRGTYVYGDLTRMHILTSPIM